MVTPTSALQEDGIAIYDGRRLALEFSSLADARQFALAMLKEIELRQEGRLLAEIHILRQKLAREGARGVR